MRAPKGPNVAVLLTVGSHDLCAGLAHGADYLFAGVVPLLPARPGIFDSFFGTPGSRPTVIRVYMAQGRTAWTTGEQPGKKYPWTHADLACGIGGFSVAAARLGGRTVWACDVDPIGEAHGIRQGRGDP